MSVFKDYSTYYDLLYKDKNYKEEANYVNELIQHNAPGAKSILNLGCGTGNHDFHLAELGYEITGIDFSSEMIDLANQKLKANPNGNISFQVGDIRNIRLGKKYDVIISLFHVISYQVYNEDLIDAFQTANTHLSANGIFIFDCWYGPGVLTDPPVVRYKVLENEVLKIHRIAEPTMHLYENKVSVNYSILIDSKKDHSAYEIHETHMMRYLFLPEIEFYLNSVSICLINHYNWLTLNKNNPDSWSIVLIGKLK